MHGLAALSLASLTRHPDPTYYDRKRDPRRVSWTRDPGACPGHATNVKGLNFRSLVLEDDPGPEYHLWRHS